KNFIFQAFQYKDAALEKYRHVPLSIAVAASACVPGVFHPLPLTDLYRNVTPKLVDGGVHDNQGAAPLLYEECQDIIVSDASGQMADKKSPASFFVLVALRAKSILEDRVRDLGLESLVTHSEAGEVKNRLILHLRDGLDVQNMKPQQAMQSVDETQRQPLPYGMDQRVQRRLSAVRTDLDAFTEVEAYSLMYSGYCLAGYKLLTNGIRKYSEGIMGTPAEWQFMKIKDFANCTTENKYYLKQLSIAGKNLFKPLLLMRKRILLPVILTLAVGVYFAWTPATAWLSKSLQQWWLLLDNCFKADCVGGGVLLALLALVFAIAIGSLLISMICWFNIRVMTPLFLHLGSLEYLKKRR
ncbi:MAG TPA: hypothetical protein DGH68_09930, partial [Bacteroidetes bacterium]|nr:hypothetical protein [Bacteroidota bacterium]